MSWRGDVVGQAAISEHVDELCGSQVAHSVETYIQITDDRDLFSERRKVVENVRQFVVKIRRNSDGRDGKRWIWYGPKRSAIFNKLYK